MKKPKVSSWAGITAAIIIAGIFIIGNIQNSIRKPDKSTLIFEGDNQAEAWIDIVIQGEDGIMYLGNMLLKDSTPTMLDVVKTINDCDKGVLIDVDNNGIIIAVNEYRNGKTHHFNIYINNRKMPQSDVNTIKVNYYDGITLRFE